MVPVSTLERNVLDLESDGGVLGKTWNLVSLQQDQLLLVADTSRRWTTLKVNYVALYMVIQKGSPYSSVFGGTSSLTRMI